MIQWLLDHAAVSEVAGFRAKPLDRCRVGPCCEDCAGLVFEAGQRQQGGSQLLADALAVYPDGQIAGILLWASADDLAYLELYDTYTQGAARRFPAVANLRTWEQHGEALAHPGSKV